MNKQQFPNTSKVLDTFSEQLAELSQNKLQSNGSVRTGTLLKSIKPITSIAEMKIGVEMVTYGKFVELGTKYFSAKPFIAPSITQLKDDMKDDIEKAYAEDLETIITPMFKQ
jgi:HK97 gp10 family phage protein